MDIGFCTTVSAQFFHVIKILSSIQLAVQELEVIQKFFLKP